jgi:hypothetical protein
MDEKAPSNDETPPAAEQPKISVLGREFRMPQSRGVRVAMGAMLIFFGLLGFLPILGFWMIPLGLLVLSYEFALVRRLRRRSLVRWERWRRPPPR